MSILYFTKYEMVAIKAIDVSELEACVKQALSEQSATALFGLHLPNCDLQLNKYIRDLGSYAKAKAATKRAETWSRAWSSGQDLIWAVQDMQKRVEKQEKETELVRIKDIIARPYFLSEKISVPVSYQWRRMVEESWAFGTITFMHNVNMSPDYSLPKPIKKLSAAKQEEQRQQDLLEHWNRLRDSALNAVREFLTEGGDGLKIPETYDATPKNRDRHLDNFSCNFWSLKATDNTRSQAMLRGQQR